MHWSFPQFTRIQFILSFWIDKLEKRINIPELVGVTFQQNFPLPLVGWKSPLRLWQKKSWAKTRGHQTLEETQDTTTDRKVIDHQYLESLRVLWVCVIYSKSTQHRPLFSVQIVCITLIFTSCKIITTPLFFWVKNHPTLAEMNQSCRDSIWGFDWKSYMIVYV